MGIFNQLFSTDKNNTEELNYLSEAAQAASIVENGIEKGDFSDLSKQLGNLPSTGINRERMVFDSPSISIAVTRAVLCVILAIVFIYFLVIGLATLMYSNQFIEDALIGFGSSLAVILINVILFALSVQQIQFYRRYEKYKNMLRYHNIVIVDDIASYSENKIDTVIKDLTKAVAKKFIPQGHFRRNNMVFMTSDIVYNAYQEKPAVYDRYYNKLIEERTRMKQRTEEIQKIMDLGQSYIQKIHDSNDIIKDKIISQKLDRIENIVTMIFHEVDINPAQADKLGLFLNYYLPTTEKLLEAYIDIDEKQVKGKSLEKTKKDIEGALDTIINSFEGILDKFYQEQEMDIASDISAMEIIMKQEGISESE